MIPTSANLRQSPTVDIDSVAPLHTWKSKALCLYHGKGRKVEGETGGLTLPPKGVQQVSAGKRPSGEGSEV